MNKIKTCKKHPKYAASRKPTSACEACWELWFTKKNGNKFSEPDYIDTLFDSIFDNDDYF